MVVHTKQCPLLARLLPQTLSPVRNRENYYFGTILLALHRTLLGRKGVIFPVRIAGIYPYYTCIPQIVPLARLPSYSSNTSVLLAWIPKTPPHRGLLLYHESFLRVSILLETVLSAYYSLVQYTVTQCVFTLHFVDALSRGHLYNPSKG